MNFKLFVDLDGVLADFDTGVTSALGQAPHEMNPRSMWPRLAKYPGFYTHLPWMSDGHELWDYVSKFSPTILTGLPLGKWAEPQKREWCRRELGADVPVLTCLSRHKAELALSHTEDGDRMILIDDRIRQKESWEELGGIFILHTSAKQSIAELRELDSAFVLPG